MRKDVFRATNDATTRLLATTGALNGKRAILRPNGPTILGWPPVLQDVGHAVEMSRGYGEAILAMPNAYFLKSRATSERK